MKKSNPEFVSNPTTPGGRKPVEFITDRAKRYRAAQAIEQTERRCIYCGQPGRGRRLDREHINGHEADNSPDNLAWACRSCNTAKGAVFAKHSIGKKTIQNNPKGRLKYRAGTGAKPIKSMPEWLTMLSIVRGATGASGATIKKAADRIIATPPDKRSEFAHEVWDKRGRKQMSLSYSDGDTFF